MTAVSKNVYFDVLDDIVDNNNNAFHRIIGMRPTDVSKKTLKNKIFKHMTAVSKNVYYDVLDDIVDNYNNTFHRIIGMKPIDVSKIKNTVPWTYVISDLNCEEITGTFYEKELKNTSKKEFRIEKIIKRRVDKLFVKWKGYDNSFNS